MESDSQTTGEAFAANLKLIRNRVAVSQQQLADELAAIGMSLNRSVISKIESGERNVSIDEALAIAVALGVEPAALLFPRSTSSVRLAPRMIVSNQRAAMWFRGLYPISQEPGMQRRFHEEREDSWVLMQVLLPGVASLLRTAALILMSATAKPAAIRQMLLTMTGDIQDANRRATEWEQRTADMESEEESDNGPR